MPWHKLVRDLEKGDGLGEHFGGVATLKVLLDVETGGTFCDEEFRVPLSADRGEGLSYVVLPMDETGEDDVEDNDDES